jgi:hypothetical protein
MFSVCFLKAKPTASQDSLWTSSVLISPIDSFEPVGSVSAKQKAVVHSSVEEPSSVAKAPAGTSPQKRFFNLNSEQSRDSSLIAQTMYIS